MVKLRNAVLSVIICLLAAGGVSADVNEYGNLHLNFRAISYPDGFGLSIEPFYNSFSRYKGIFGQNWASEFEVSLEIVAGNSIIVHEYGGGADNFYTLEDASRESMHDAIEDIIQAAAESRDVVSSADVAAMRERLSTDGSYRSQMGSSYGRSKLVSTRGLPAGIKLVSTLFGGSFIVRVREGYVRTVNDGSRVEYFDNFGKLVRITDSANNSIRFSRNYDGTIRTIIDNRGRRLTFTYNSRRLVERIEAEDGRFAAHRYNSRDELIYIRDADGNIHEFEYDGEGNNNLTKIINPEKTTSEFTYYGNDLAQRIKSEKDEAGNTTSYRWVQEKDSLELSSAEVILTDAERHQVSYRKTEYRTRSKPLVGNYTYKTTSIIGDDTTETVYYKETGKPLSITNNGVETRFEYDAELHVTKKEIPAQGIWSRFTYDPKGNLVEAINSAGKSLKIRFDEAGRIAELTDQDRRRFQFKYDEVSRLTEINDSQLGVLTVVRGAEGQILRGPKGADVAEAFDEAYQQMSELLEPTAVSIPYYY